MTTESPILRFDIFELDRTNRMLRRGGVPVELGSRYFDALALMAERRGELVTKEEFMNRVWHGIPVTDEALTQCIRTLRRVLDDDAANPRFIQTVPKHGYRFLTHSPARPEATRRAPVSQVAGACTLAGLAAGIIAGLFYGIVAGTGGAGRILILAAMVGSLGLLAGAGLGAGIAGTMAWRGKTDPWAIAGAAIGGLAVGALGNLLGREGIGLLSGLAIAEVTGPFEGLIIGTATGIVAWAACGRMKRRSIVAIALLAGPSAGAFIHLAGGTLLAGSLGELQQGLPGTQLAMERVGGLIGRPGFTGPVLALTAIVEASIFVGAMAAGLLFLHQEGDASAP